MNALGHSLPLSKLYNAIHARFSLLTGLFQQLYGQFITFFFLLGVNQQGYIRVFYYYLEDTNNIYPLRSHVRK